MDKRLINHELVHLSVVLADVESCFKPAPLTFNNTLIECMSVQWQHVSAYVGMIYRIYGSTK